MKQTSSSKELRSPQCTIEGIPSFVGSFAESLLRQFKGRVHNLFELRSFDFLGSKLINKLILLMFEYTMLLKHPSLLISLLNWRNQLGKLESSISSSLGRNLKMPIPKLKTKLSGKADSACSFGQASTLSSQNHHATALIYFSRCWNPAEKHEKFLKVRIPSVEKIPSLSHHDILSW